MIDYTRWDVVRDDAEASRSRFGRMLPNSARSGLCRRALLREREKMMNWAGRTWLQAYECAAMILSHTEARGSPSAMKGSYIRVEGNKHPLRYHQFDPKFLRTLGLDINFEARQRPKIIPLHELVL